MKWEYSCLNGSVSPYKDWNRGFFLMGLEDSEGGPTNWYTYLMFSLLSRNSDGGEIWESELPEM